MKNHLVKIGDGLLEHLVYSGEGAVASTLVVIESPPERQGPEPGREGDAPNRPSIDRLQHAQMVDDARFFLVDVLGACPLLHPSGRGFIVEADSLTATLIARQPFCRRIGLSGGRTY